MKGSQRKSRLWKQIVEADCGKQIVEADCGSRWWIIEANLGLSERKEYGRPRTEHYVRNETSSIGGPLPGERLNQLKVIQPLQTVDYCTLRYYCRLLRCSRSRRFQTTT